MFFLLRFSEAEFVTSLIFKRFLSNIWSSACENWSESLRTDSVAVRVKQKSNRTKSYFSRNSLPRLIFWQSLGILDCVILHTSSRYLRTAALKCSWTPPTTQYLSLLNSNQPFLFYSIRRLRDCPRRIRTFFTPNPFPVYFIGDYERQT